MNLFSSQETLDAIKALSSFFDDNTISSRRNLRSTFEKRSLQINKEFLASFNEVNKIIDDLYQTADQMNQNCIKVKNKFNEIKSKNQSLLSVSNDLQKKVDLTNCKQVLLNRFIDKFQLTDEEQSLLNRTDEIQVNENFFKLFNKIKKIHNDAKIILFESNYQTTGIEIIDNMANNLEILYDKLYKWTVKTIRTYNSDQNNLNKNLDNLNSQHIYKALKLLEERPILFKLCLDEYSTIRRSIVSQQFIEQLTKSNLTKENYQSINFVTEILSWVYETVQVERNHLVNLFKECSNQLKRLNEKNVFVGDEKSMIDSDSSLNSSMNSSSVNINTRDLLNEEDKLKDYLSFIMESLDEPIKVRLEQILLKETNCINSFNLRNLLKYYNQQLLNLLNRRSKLNQTVSELYLVSHRIFINSLNCYCTFDLSKNSNYDFEEISPTLNSTPIISKTNQLLKELISSQQNSNCLTKDEKQEIFSTIFNIIFEPYLNAVNTTVLKLSYLEKHIFIINCLNEMYDVLGRTEFADSFRDQLKSKILENCNQIVYEYCSNSLSLCDLSTLYNTILKEQTNPTKQSLAVQAGCYSLGLQSCNKKIEHFINSYDNYFLAKIMLVKKNETRSKIKHACLEQFCQIYQLIFEQVHSPNSGYDDPNKILQIRPEIIREKFNLD